MSATPLLDAIRARLTGKPVTDADRLSDPSSQCGQLQRIALDWLQQKRARDEIPTSLRFLFYELEQQGHVSKSPLRLDGKPKKRRPDADLMDAVTHLRNQGIIPWDWIVDESREVHIWRCAASVADFVAESVPRARIDPWPDVPQPFLITESRGAGGILARGVACDYLVPVVPTGGMCKGFLMTQVVPLLEERDATVLYIGDYDLAGGQIEANTRDVLERALGRALPWRRLAVTAAQVKDFKARGIRPIQKHDRRCKDGRPHLAYEAEALGQAFITNIVRKALDGLLPQPLADVLEREQDQRSQVLRLLARHMK
jgi:hypothetical protein